MFSTLSPARSSVADRRRGRGGRGRGFPVRSEVLFHAQEQARRPVLVICSARAEHRSLSMIPVVGLAVHTKIKLGQIFVQCFRESFFNRIGWHDAAFCFLSSSGDDHQGTELARAEEPTTGAAPPAQCADSACGQMREGGRAGGRGRARRAGRRTWSSTPTRASRARARTGRSSATSPTSSCAPRPHARPPAGLASFGSRRGPASARRMGGGPRKRPQKAP